MTHKYIVLFFVLMTVTLAKVSITDLSNNFSPSSEQDYINFIKLFLGHHQESSTLSPALVQILANKRPSLTNAVNQIVFLLVPTSQSQNIIEQNNLINFSGKMLQKVVAKAPQNFVVKVLSHHDEQQIKSYQKEDVLVNVISGDKKQLDRLAKTLSYQEYEKSQLQMARKLQSQPSSNDSTYLIKFFFSLLFVFVIIGIISFIAGNQGKKDTLLYAKFIADIGNSR